MGRRAWDSGFGPAIPSASSCARCASAPACGASDKSDTCAKGRLHRVRRAAAPSARAIDQRPACGASGESSAYSQPWRFGPITPSSPPRMCLEAHETARRIVGDRITYTKTAGGAQSTRHAATRPGTSCRACGVAREGARGRRRRWRALRLGTASLGFGTRARESLCLVVHALRIDRRPIGCVAQPRRQHAPSIGARRAARQRASGKSSAYVQRAARSRRACCDSSRNELPRMRPGTREPRWRRDGRGRGGSGRRVRDS